MQILSYTSKRIWLVLIGVAFAVRGVFAIVYPHTPALAEGAYDAASGWALSGQGYAYFYARALYIYYTKAVYSLFGPSRLPIILGNIIMGTLAVWVVGKASTFILSKPDYAIFPAIMTALNPIFIFWVEYTFPETMFILLLALAILVGHRFLEKPSWKLAIIYGILLILLVFTRAHGLIVAPLMALWLAWAANRDRLSRWRMQSQRNRVLTATAMFLAMLAVSSMVVLTINNVHLPPQSRAWPFTVLMGGHPAQNELHKRLAGPDYGWLTQIENRPYIMEDIGSVREHIRVAAVKLIRFWYPLRPQFSLKHKLVLYIVYGGLSFLAIVGFVQLWNVRRPTLFLFLTIFVAFTIVTIVSFPDEEGRYRLPCDLLLIVIAGEPVGLLWNRLRFFVYPP